MKLLETFRNVRDIADQELEDHQVPFDPDAWQGIVKNLGARQLEEDENSLLALGPKFCLPEADLNRPQFNKDLKAGFKRMNLAVIHEGKEDLRTEEEKRFYIRKSEYDPKCPNAHLQTYQDKIIQKFNNWVQPKRVLNNEDIKRRKVLKRLQKDDTIDIKLDDKSGSFVVAPPEVYKSACEKDLDKPMAYQIGPQDTEPQYLKKDIEDSICRLVNSMVYNGEIKKEIADWILIKEKDFKLARYYANWKCHSFKPPVFSFAEAAVRGIILCIGTPN